MRRRSADHDLWVEIAEDPDCVGVFASGQPMALAGGGFAPGGPVELTLHAEGTEPIMVGTFAADGAGRFEQTVVLPAGALISELSGLELVGGTPAGEVLVLVEHINVVDPTHPCADADRFDFGGFQAPIANPPAVNGARAGQSIPIKFSLGGDYGLDVIAAGSPSSQRIACTGGEPASDLDQIESPGASGLTYDSSTDQYTYVWKTQKQWADTCRRLHLQLTDGSHYYAAFDFR